MPNQTQGQIQSSSPPSNSSQPIDINSLVIAMPIALVISIAWNIYKSGKTQGNKDTEVAIALREMGSRLGEIEKKIDAIVTLESKIETINLQQERHQSSITRIYGRLEELTIKQNTIAMHLAKNSGFEY